MKQTVLVTTKQEKQQVFNKLETFGTSSGLFKHLIKTDIPLYVSFNPETNDWSYSPVSWKNKKECINLQEFLNIQLNEASLL
mgnify:FL=1|jgi:hypothetical protein